MSQTLINVWIDCDPGHDDAFAIMLAGYSDCLRINGISTIGGNQTVEKTTINALKVCTFASLEHLNVYKGSSKSMLIEQMVCPEIHGETGLDSKMGIANPTKKAVEKNAILAMRDSIIDTNTRYNGEKTTIIATGALTNVALLLLTFPEIKPMIESVTILGGCMTTGNMSPNAEFNIMVDPEAAKVVFDSGVKVVMVPLEVSHKALITEDIKDRIREIGDTQFTRLMIDLLEFFGDTYRTLFGFEAPPLHDPLAVAAVVAPQLFTYRFLRVDVECNSPLCKGQTVCDVWGMSKLPKNVHVAVDCDIPKFFDMLIDALAKANAKSPLNK